MTEVTVYEDGRCGWRGTGGGLVKFDLVEVGREVVGWGPFKRERVIQEPHFTYRQAEFHDYGKMIVPAWAWSERDE